MFVISTYDDWLRVSPKAQLLRAESRDRDGNRCVRCGSTEYLEMHHLLGYRGRWDDTQLQDVVTLCDDCHEIMHGAKDIKFLLPAARDKKRWEQARRLVLKCGGVLRPELVRDLAGRGKVIQMPKPPRKVA